MKKTKMTAKEKGQYLVNYSEVHTDVRAVEINKIIDDAIDLRLTFLNITQLSEYAAKKLAALECAPVASSTLRRNITYREILIYFFMKTDPSKLPKSLDNDIANKVRIRELLINIKSRDKKISELNRSLLSSKELLSKRLSLEKTQENINNKSIRELISKSNDETDESIFMVLYWALSTLCSIQFNLKDGYLYDEAENNKIMTAIEFPKFFKWLSTKI